MDPREPGLFRKWIGKKGQEQLYLLTVYVDDTLVCGPNWDKVTEILDKILVEFPGKYIFPEILQNGDEKSDLLG